MTKISKKLQFSFLCHGDTKANLPHHIAYEFSGKSGPAANRYQTIHIPKKQVHGTDILQVPTEQACDGVWTSSENVAVGIRTADCLPILIAGRGIVMAVHAGWRGLVDGILLRALRILATVDDEPEGLYIVIGPTISREKFEIGPDVADVFWNAPLGLSQEERCLCLAKGASDRWHLDLPLAAALCLSNAGVAEQRISVIQRCTYKDDSLNSYRRDGAKVGSNVSWMMLSG